jgi:DNA mismatch repair protein MutS2
MNAHTLQILELERVKEIISSFASSPLGSSKALGLTPSSNPDQIETEMDRVTEMTVAMDSTEFSLGPLKDVRASLERCGHEGTAGARDFFEMSVTLRTGRQARAYFQKNADTYPLLGDLSASIGLFENFEGAVFRSIDDEGQILDGASAELSSIRRRREKLKETIRDKLDSIMRARKEILQESLVTIRQERYVIPLKSEGKGKMSCVVHDVSASGATLFVEPLPVVELNNELQQNRKSEEAEIRRILSALGSMVRENSGEMEKSLEALSHIDLVLAKARFSREFSCTRPEVDESGIIEIKGGRHPLLAAKKGRASVVPLDLTLGQDFTTLLISGPNAGGKTVVLKTVGILALMSQCGIHIPVAAGSRLSVFDSILADIGDEQSIERDLSTFSSHIRNISEIMSTAGSSTLVLLDEVGVGTDPRSGTGIAMAVLSELTRRGTRTLATSHYGDLKTFVHTAPRMSNASVEFDSETLLPTYRLVMGIPGSSNTFEMAEKLGMDKSLLAEAAGYVNGESTRAEEMIASLEKSLFRSERLAEETRAEKERLRGLIEEYDGRMRRIREEEKAAKKRRRDQTRRAVEGARSLVENLVREIKESDARKDVVKKVQAALAAELDRVAEPPARTRAPEIIKEGDLVYVEPFKASGRVLSVHKGSVRVEVGSVTCEVPVSAVSKSGGSEEPGSGEARVPETTAELEVSLIGMDREEALDALDRHLDRAFMSGLPVTRIVHGKGRGVLKKAVEEALSRDSRVESFREGAPEEGGWGVTIAKIKT